MRSIFCLFLFLSACTVHAYEPVIVVPEHVNDIVVVDDTNNLYGYYGELNDFPHTFVILTTEPFTLYARILEPGLPEAENILRGIIVRDRDNGRGVEEVARMPHKDASWDLTYNFTHAVRYFEGPVHEAELGSGTYRVEVSTPENKGKYVLILGNPEATNGPGYFGTLRDIYEVNRFYGKPPIALIMSPYVFVPFILLIVSFVISWRYYRNRYA